LPATPVPSCDLDTFSAHHKEVPRRNLAQIGVLRDLACSPPSAFREISLGERLQPPGNPPEQMFPVPGSRFFPKYLLILFAQTGECRPAQALDFHQYRIIHSFRFLSVAVNHSHMNAPRGPTSKSENDDEWLALRHRPE
jgi:hypothetical protein